MTQLDDIRNSLADGRSVVVLGPAGIGKTTLADRALDGIVTVTGQCFSVLANRTYYPLSDARGRATAGAPTDVAAEVHAELAGRVLRIEDAHWADPSTHAVMAELVGRVPLLVTCRTAPPWAAHPAADVTIVEGLPRSSALALARRLHPHLSGRELDQLVDIADGNPLLIGQLAAGGRGLPDLDAAVVARLERLPDDVVAGVRMLAIHGRPASPATIGLAADDTVGGLLRCSEDAVWFIHDRLASAIRDQLAEDDERALRVELAGRCDDIDAAAHYLTLGDARRASTCARRAAAGADIATRADMLLLATHALGDAADTTLRLEAADALLDVHRPAAARELLATLGTEGDAGGAPATDADTAAAVGLRRIRAMWMEGRPWDALHLADELLVDVTSLASRTETRLIVERAQMLVHLRVGDPSVVPTAADALQRAEAAGAAVARARNTLGLARSHSGQPGWDALFHDAAAAARADGDVEEEFAANYWLVSSLGFYGPMRDALALGEAMLARSQTLGMRTWHDHFLAARAVHLCATGWVPDDDVERCTQLLEQQPQLRNRAQVELVLSVAYADRGATDRAHEVIAAGRQRARTDQDRSLLCCAELEVALAEQDIELAERSLAHLASLGAGFFGLNALAESAAIHLSSGEPNRIAIPSCSNTLTPVLDVVERERAAFDALAAGSLDRAISGFADAAARWMARGLHRFEVRALVTSAEITLQSGDLTRADSFIERAERSSTDHGGLSGVRIADLRRRVERESAARRVTTRELEVLQLLSTGASRTIVADRLGIELTTVNSHLRSAMRKLGCHTSAQAVAAVAATLPRE